MKRLKPATIVIVALILYSCGPAATFDKPQPENVKALLTFPERLLGNYLAADQASVLTISNKLISRHYEFDFKEHKDSLGSTYKISGDTLINLKEGTKEKISLIGDTVTQHISGTDTLFNVSADNVLKKFKGYFFLNSRHGNDAWEVKKLALQKGRLTIGSISDKDEVRKLKEITETTADTTSTHFTLSRRQFKKFMKQEGFADQETFTRMSGKGW